MVKGWLAAREMKHRWDKRIVVHRDLRREPMHDRSRSPEFLGSPFRNMDRSHGEIIRAILTIADRCHYAGRNTAVSEPNGQVPKPPCREAGGCKIAGDV